MRTTRRQAAGGSSGNKMMESRRQRVCRVEMVDGILILAAGLDKQKNLDIFSFAPKLANRIIDTQRMDNAYKVCDGMGKPWLLH